MAKRLTVKYLRTLTEELLRLQAAMERYKELEQLIKDGLQEIGFKEMVTDQGRVFISTSERVTVSPDLAREVLGLDALRIIRIKETVPNELIRAFVEVGDITPEQRDELLAGAEKTPITALHVRPLK